MSEIEIILPGESLTLDPQGAGFAHGFGLFETLRIRGGSLEFHEAHWLRLAKSAGELGLACPFDRQAVLGAVRTLAKELPADALIKFSLLKDGYSTRLFVYSRPLAQLPDSIGLLMDCPGRIDEFSPVAGHKTHNYLENNLVLQAAQAAGCYDGLRLNTKGLVAEGAISNIFFYRDGGMHTPGMKSGLLPGIMREALIRVLAVEEGNYTLADLLSAEAVYLTNSSIGLQPVDRLLSEGQEIPLPSREHRCFQPAVSLLADGAVASAVYL